MDDHSWENNSAQPEQVATESSENNEMPQIRINQHDYEERWSTESQIDKIMIDIEGNGRFKYFALISLSASMASLDFIYLSLAYLVQPPVYECKSAGSNTWKECTEDEFCGKDNIEWKINWNDKNSIHNWYQRLDLMCAPAIKLDVLMSAWFFGIVVTVLWVPRFSDKRSRKFF